MARVRYSFDGGASVEQAFEDKPTVQFTEVQVKARKITIQILDTISGDPDFDYTAISEIVVDRGER